MCEERVLGIEIPEGTRLYRIQIDHRVFESGVMHSVLSETKPVR